MPDHYAFFTLTLILNTWTLNHRNIGSELGCLLVIVQMSSISPVKGVVWQKHSRYVLSFLHQPFIYCIQVKAMSRWSYNRYGLCSQKLVLTENKCRFDRQNWMISIQRTLLCRKLDAKLVLRYEIWNIFHSSLLC